MKTYKINFRNYFTDVKSEKTYMANDWEDARVKGLALQREANEAIGCKKFNLIIIEKITDTETGKTFIGWKHN